jgi:menaquinol-cytochrome c reductase cytochrome b/c subunit
MADVAQELPGGQQFPPNTIDEAKRQRLLELVRGRAMARPTDLAEDEVMVWPSLVVVEAVCATVFLLIITILSILVNGPLIDRANPNQTPNPSKAPWYFSGLQELLTMFHPMVAGVTIPGMGIFLLIVTPYVDKTPSQNPADRKFAISIFTVFLMFWAVLVIIGSFFRAKGFNFTFPWSNGIFFDL